MKIYSTVLLIYNPMALRGKIEDYIPRIKERLSLRYQTINAVTSSSENGSEDLAFKYAEKYDIIIACGGDGTVKQVINGIMKSNFRPMLGILPFGTCNDIARTLNIPLDFEKALDCILRLNLVNYDVMFDGKNYYAYSLATGFLTHSVTQTSYKAKLKYGRFAYFCSALKNIFNFKAIPLTVTYDGKRFHGKICYFMILEGSFTGGFKIDKDRSLDNGKVKFLLIKKSKGAFLTFLKLFLRGLKSIVKNKNVIIAEAKQIEIENHSNYPFCSDGEKENFLKKVITVRKGLKIIKK